MNNTNDLLKLFENTNYWIDNLTRHDTRYVDNWAGLKEVQLAHIYMLNQFINQKFETPSYPVKRGIVIGAGGAKYFGCAFACFWVLRKLGCDLPVEFWYLDEYEMDNKMKQLCDLYGIRYINATKFAADNNVVPRLLNGWELKPFSTLYSDFEEVLYLDADNIPSINPTYLFDIPEYRDLGSIFWPDLPPYKRKEWLPVVCWENVGLPYRNEPDFETGQYMVNKAKCYRELRTTMWMNEHSDWFYKFVYGDKSTFHLAWRKCGSDYVIPKRPAGWKHPCILQFDTNNSLVFQHACQGKELMFDGKGPTNHFNHHLVKEAYEERNKHWSGTIYSWQEMNEEEAKYAKEFIGRYRYTRVNLDSRYMQLMDNGIIGEGKAKCERRWSVRIIDGVPAIIGIGAAHKESEIAMFFAKADNNMRTFRGKWSAFEKCDILLERQ